MPAIVPVQLQAALQLSTTTIAQCFKLTRVDGTIIGYTNHTSDLIIDGVTYYSRPGITPSQESLSADLAVDNLEVQAMFDNSAIKKADTLSGLYDHARFNKFIIDYTASSAGSLVRISGFLAEVKVRSDGIFTAQLLSLNDVVRQNPLEITSPICRALLFDSRCKIAPTGNDQFGDPLKVTGAVTSVLDGVMTRNTVVFQNATGGGAAGTNMFLRTLAGTTFGSCGAASTVSAATGNTFAEWAVPNASTTGAAGLSTSTSVSSITNIRYGIKWSNGTCWMVSGGIVATKLGTFTSGARFRFSAEGGIAKFYKDDILINARNKITISGYPLYFGVAMATSGAQITNAILGTSAGGYMQFSDSTRTEVIRTFQKSYAEPGVIMEFRQFANGRVVWTSGLNNGLTCTVKDWDADLKAFTLNRPTPYQISVGDSYIAYKGCNQLLSTCTTVFNNAPNNRSESQLPGTERVISRP